MDNIEAPLIINLAPTGIKPNRHLSPFAPLQPLEIIRDVNNAADYGISSVHIHARDLDDSPSHKKEIYAEIIAGIRSHHPDLVICVSCSGRKFTEFEQRSQVAQETSLNTPKMIQQLALMMQEREIKPELEIFDLGMANYANYLLRKKYLSEPLYANIILGNIATAQPTLIELAAIIHSLPASTIWSLGGIGKYQLSTASLATAFANGVRIGLEDNLWIDKKGEQQATNIELVKRVHQMAKLLNRPVMKPEQLRALLCL
jgi:3-keto-5-aminohexanoate cleavage enzyme